VSASDAPQSCCEAMDELTELRSVTRAKAQEDFEYFARQVLGLRTMSALRRAEAHRLWLATRTGEVCEVRSGLRSEAFAWLFPDVTHCDGVAA
jgi:hypothetical protein